MENNTTSQAQDLTGPYSFAAHGDVARRIRDGRITAEEVKAAYERILAAEPDLKRELNQKPLKELAPHGTGGLKKAAVIDRIFTNMLHRYVVGQSVHWSPIGESYRDALRRHVDQVTDASIQEAAAEYRHRVDAARKALSNPETLDDFRQFVEAKGEQALLPEQRAKWDDLIAERRQSLRVQKQDTIVTQADLGGVSMSLTEAWHDKQNRPAFVVQLDRKIDREQYQDLNIKAKQLGGYYSSFRGGRAIPGFQFRTKDDAERFMSLQSGDVNRTDLLQDREEQQQKSAAERLGASATRLQDRAEESLKSERATNTARRASMAANAEDEARRQLAFAGTLQNVASAIADGNANHLTGVRTKAQVETLETLLLQARRASIRKENAGGLTQDETERPVTLADIDHAEYPYPRAGRERLLRMLEQIKDKPGAKLLAARLEKRAAKASDWLVQFKLPSAIEDFRELASKGERAGLSSFEVSAIRNDLAPFTRLQAMGIESLPELRAALRQFFPLRGARQTEDPVKAKERALIGRKIDGFFPTPRSVIDHMLDLAEIKKGMTVLEPSAGKGDILDAVRERHPDAQVEAVELVSMLCDIITAKGHQVVASDFLTHSGQYDRIVMNPPFERGQDIDHVRKAFDLLAPGGRVVAVMSEGPFFREDTKSSEFREWLDEVGGTSEQMAEAFKGKEAFRQTGVNTRLVVITKAA